jgi:subtilase family serine protease
VPLRLSRGLLAAACVFALILFGLGEHFFTTAQAAEMHSILLVAEAHHVTVVAGSGDNGGFSDTWWFGTAVKEVSLPASDPLVLAAGGTMFTGNLSAGAYISETAWNAQNGSLARASEHRGAALATCTPVPPIRTASPGSRQ